MGSNSGDLMCSLVLQTQGLVNQKTLGNLPGLEKPLAQLLFFLDSRESDLAVRWDNFRGVTYLTLATF